MLHSALEKLSKAASEDRMLSSRVGVIGGHEDYPESLALTPAASESVSTLIQATEQLLSTGESPRGAVELVEAETCRKVCFEQTGAVRSGGCLRYTTRYLVLRVYPVESTASPQLAALSRAARTVRHGVVE